MRNESVEIFERFDVILVPTTPFKASFRSSRESGSSPRSGPSPWTSPGPRSDSILDINYLAAFAFPVRVAAFFRWAEP